MGCLLIQTFRFTPRADAAHVGTIAFEAGVPVLGLAEQESSLEDAFLELTEEAR